MIKFLIQRPIAVLMAFTACFIVGLVTYFTLPVSLLPDISIPEITVQVSAKNTSARELENTVVKPVRQQLIQVAALKDMTSETRDGAGIIRLSFDFGTKARPGRNLKTGETVTITERRVVTFHPSGTLNSRVTTNLIAGGED